MRPVQLFCSSWVCTLFICRGRQLLGKHLALVMVLHMVTVTVAALSACSPAVLC